MAQFRRNIPAELHQFLPSNPEHHEHWGQQSHHQLASGGEVKKSNFSTIEGVLGVLGYRHHNMELVSNGISHQCVISFYLRQNQLCPDHHLHIKKSSYSSLIFVFDKLLFFLSSGELLIQML